MFFRYSLKEKSLNLNLKTEKFARSLLYEYILHKVFKSLIWSKQPDFQRKNSRCSTEVLLCFDFSLTIVSQFEGVFGSFTCIFWHYKLNFEMERSGTIANVWFSQIFCIESWLFGLIVLCCLANCLSKFPLLTKVSFSMSVIS